MTLPQVTENDLDHCRDGDGQHGAEEAGQLDCGQDRDRGAFILLIHDFKTQRGHGLVV
jgi:hypothetical protein